MFRLAKKWTGRQARRVLITSSSEPALPAACWQTGFRPTRRTASCLLEAGGRDSSFWLKLPVGYFRTVYDERFSRIFRDAAMRRVRPDAAIRLAARARPRRLQLDQRTDLHPRTARGLRRMGTARRNRLGFERRCCRYFKRLERLRRRADRSTAARSASWTCPTYANDHPYCRAWIDAARASSACRAIRRLQRRRAPTASATISCSIGNALALQARQSAFLHPVAASRPT